MKVILAPSILSADMYNLSRDIQEVKKHGVTHIHFDVMDGHFVPNISYGSKILADMRKGEPDLFIDAHLMISRPDIYWEGFAKAGADLISIHLEVLSVNEKKTLLKNIKAYGCQTGIAINPDSDIEELVRYFGQIDQVIIMGVKPGFGGQSYIENTTQRTEELFKLRDKYGATFKIMIDGGINNKTAQLVYKHADILVSGSYIFGADNMKRAIEAIELKK